MPAQAIRYPMDVDIHPDATGLAPGNVHRQVGHLGPNAWQFLQVLGCPRYVSVVLVAKNCGRRFDSLRLCPMETDLDSC